MDTSDKTNWFIIGAGILIILIGGWWVVTRTGSQTGSPTTATTSSTTGTSSNASGSSTTTGNPSAVSTGEAVSVGDQPAGSFVVAASATLTQMGWLAVRDQDGRVLGAARLEPGTHEAVQIPLLRNTTTGDKYQVLIYIDDGDKEFDLHKDTLVTNADGSVAGAAFTALNGD